MIYILWICLPETPNTMKHRIRHRLGTYDKLYDTYLGKDGKSYRYSQCVVCHEHADVNKNIVPADSQDPLVSPIHPSWTQSPVHKYLLSVHRIYSSKWGWKSPSGLRRFIEEENKKAKADHKLLRQRQESFAKWKIQNEELYRAFTHYADDTHPQQHETTPLVT